MIASKRGAFGAMPAAQPRTSVLGGGLNNNPLLARAVWRVSASNELSGSRGLVDLSGNGLHAYYGGNSTTPTTNDPIRLTFSGSQYVYLPGSSGNYISTPDSAALDIIGDIDLRAYIALSDWTPSANCSVVGKFISAGDQRSYRLDVTTTGTLILRWSTLGTAASGLSAESTAPTGFSDGASMWIRATLDVNNGAGGYSVVFYTSTNGDSWTQLGSTVTGSGVTSIYSGTAILEVGTSQSGSNDFVVGNIYRAQVYNGINGTIVADFDASQLTEPYASYVGPMGNTWTINRSSSGRKSTVVDRDMLLLGTDDFLEVADNALLNFSGSDSFTIVWVGRTHGSLLGQTRLAKKTGSGTTGAGYVLRASSTTATTGFFTVSDGVTAESAALMLSPESGYASMLSGVRTAAVSTSYYDSRLASPDTVTVSPSLNPSNSEVLRIGRFSGAGTSYGDFVFFGAAIFREPLSAINLKRLAREFAIYS